VTRAALLGDQQVVAAAALARSINEELQAP
jgi:hypothetical protein